MFTRECEHWKKGSYQQISTQPQMFPFELLSMADRTVNSKGLLTYLAAKKTRSGVCVWPKLIRENKLRVGLAALNTIPCLCAKISCQKQKRISAVSFVCLSPQKHAQFLIKAEQAKPHTCTTGIFVISQRRKHLSFFIKLGVFVEKGGN